MAAEEQGVRQANAAFANSSFLFGGNAAYIEQLYAAYEANPASVDAEWREFFAGLNDDAAAVAPTPRAPHGSARTGRSPRRASLSPRSTANGRSMRRRWPTRSRARPPPTARPEISPAELHRATRDSVRAIMMIRAYRMRGHLHANLDPLGLDPQKDHEELHPSTYGFTDADYDRKIFIDHVLGLEYATLREMLAILRRTYCDTIGWEFMHISDPAEKAWIQERIEGPHKEVTFTKEGKRAILQKLVEAEGFEKFLDVRYTGTKRFGLDGGEAMIPGAGADHQARRRARREGNRAWAWPIAAA